jgi:hypothetical protein
MVDKVGYTRPTTAMRTAAKVGKADGVGFSKALSAAQAAAAAGEAAEAAETTAVGSVNPFLGFQEVDDKDFERRKAFKKGRLTLEALSQLRDALLFGTLPVSTIEKLERIVAEERGTTTDPVLNGILDEIELRAAVELAKLEVAMGGAGIRG